MSRASPISVHVVVPFGRSAFVVFAATPTFATEAVPSVALVASSVEAVVPDGDRLSRVGRCLCSDLGLD